MGSEKGECYRMIPHTLKYGAVAAKWNYGDGWCNRKVYHSLPVDLPGECRLRGFHML